MPFNLQWEGRATDFVPDLLKTIGQPGPVANHAKTAIWEVVQAAGERDPHAWVAVTANGWEEDDPGLGKFTLSMEIKPEPPEVSKNVVEEEPVDLRGWSSSAPEPATPGGSPGA